MSHDRSKPPHKTNGRFRQSTRPYKFRRTTISRYEVRNHSRTINGILSAGIVCCCIFLLTLKPTESTEPARPDETFSVTRDYGPPILIAPTNRGVHSQSEVRSEPSIPKHDKGKDTGHSKQAESNHTSGSNKVSKPKEVVKTSKVNMDALAKAVAVAETGGCKTGTAIKYHNCVGIRRQGHFVKYATHKDSLEDFKVTWNKYYGGIPTMEQAKVYTNNDKPHIWLNIVLDKYQEYNS